jgi:hypothetical protein
VEERQHVHIISAGESIHKTFPKAIHEFKMNKAIIIVEDNVFYDGAGGHSTLIIQSIDEVKKTADKLEIAFEIKRIPDISLKNIRNAVLEIFNDQTNAIFYFNITGGTKVLSNGLFMMSIWIEGTTYHVGESGQLQILTIPKIHTENITKNSNYIFILEILTNSKDKEILLKNLYSTMKDAYKPLREENKKLKRTLSRGTLSKWIYDLISWGLVSEEYVENSRKEKKIKITDDGIFTLKYIKAANKRN